MQQYMPDVRSNTRVMIDDAAWAKVVYDRVAPYLPETLKGYRPVELNERLRFLKYTPGERRGGRTLCSMCMCVCADTWACW